MRAIRIHEIGGPEVLKYEECANPQPGDGQALVELQAIGVNYTDIYTRSGINPPASLPMIPGIEGAGVVKAIGDGVTDVRVGDVVAYIHTPGSYAEQVVVPAHRLVKLPEGIDAKTAAAAILQGMTAHYLVHSTYPLKAGERVLIHAGAGGVGLLLIQMAKRLGSHVFTTVSTEEKAALAREAGADQVIIYTRENFEEAVKEATDGQGVQVVYDGVGKTTFDQGINCLAPRGYMVLFGTSSGRVSPVDPRVLNRGSYFFTRPGLIHHVATRQELLQRAQDLFDWITSGQLKVRISKTFPLAEAVEAHRAMEGRQTTGKVLLLP
ncbi:MAG: quinone oxidoreductase [Dehalococcoidia bacterium]